MGSLGKTEFDLSTLSISSQLEAANLLTEAFFDNPAHSFIYPNSETRHEMLHVLMYKNLSAQFTVGQSFAALSPNGDIWGMGFWHAPHAPKVNIFQIIRFGFLSLYFRQGKEVFERMIFTSREIEKRRLSALQGQESWYLNNMVVAARLRGRGIGGSLLRHELATRIDNSGYPASLTTQKKENVRFYQSLGFEVRHNDFISRNGSGFENWIMVRDVL